jgi:hypothetical protein
VRRAGQHQQGVRQRVASPVVCQLVQQHEAKLLARQLVDEAGRHEQFRPEEPEQRRAANGVGDEHGGNGSQTHLAPACVEQRERFGLRPMRGAEPAPHGDRADQRARQHDCDAGEPRDEQCGAPVEGGVGGALCALDGSRA